MHVSKCGDMTKGMAPHTLYNGCPSSKSWPSIDPKIGPYNSKQKYQSHFVFPRSLTEKKKKKEEENSVIQFAPYTGNENSRIYNYYFNFFVNVNLSWLSPKKNRYHLNYP